MTTTLHDALGGMRALNQWFIWRLEWSAEESKYNKTPCALDGTVYRIDASLPANWHGYSTVSGALDRLNAQVAPSGSALRYTLGFWLTKASGYWFLDIDKCVTDAGDVAPHAAAMVAAFPGALCEWSSSRRGLHVIGRGVVGEHRSRDVHKLHMEFYTQDRGIAFGLDGQAQGSADVSFDCSELVRVYFPPRAAGDASEGPRAEWRGPSDDDELIRRALAARVSADVAFGGKAGFKQLWEGTVEHSSESDMALAAHLAFWTGCDEERMERLMRRSGLRREKWDEHRTYLRELTIRNACRSTARVYAEPERSQAAQQEVYGIQQLAAITATSVGDVITPEVTARVKELLAQVSACGTVEDMHNQVLPAIRAAGVPPVYQEQLVRAVNSKLDFYDAKLPVSQLRALLFPPVVAGTAGGDEAPLWLQRHCYVMDGDFFYDVSNGARMSHQGFIAVHSRLMPLRTTGGRENPVEWAFTRWNITTVNGLMYRPDQPTYFQWQGLDYANLYSPASVPATAGEYTAAGLAGIEAFQRMLWDMCGRREAVYQQVLWWLAWNVQRPGQKVMWAVLIKGSQGDGKSLIAAVMRAAMGSRNVSVTSNSTLNNSGGFTDWAVRGALNVMEEVHLVGKQAHQLYNAMKEFITNKVVNVNAKGKGTYDTYNCTNHMGYSNHNDGLPLERDDRRWMIVFTPWESTTAMRAYCGLDDAGWAARTGAIDHACMHCEGELRAWLLSVDVGAGFQPRADAPWTPEKAKMLASSKDDAESVAETLIAEGVHGVGRKVLSSNCLTHALRLKAQHDGFEVPKSTTLNHMLNRMGFSKLPQQVKWNRSTHTVWVRNGFTADNEVVRSELDATSNLP